MIRFALATAALLVTTQAQASLSNWCGDALEDAGINAEQVAVVDGAYDGDEVAIVDGAYRSADVLGVLLEDDRGIFFLDGPRSTADLNVWLDEVVLPEEDFVGWVLAEELIGISPVPVPGS